LSKKIENRFYKKKNLHFLSKGILGGKKNKGSKFLHKSQNSVLNFFYLIKQNTLISGDFADP